MERSAGTFDIHVGRCCGVCHASASRIPPAEPKNNSRQSKPKPLWLPNPNEMAFRVCREVQDGLSRVPLTLDGASSSLFRRSCLNLNCRPCANGVVGLAGTYSDLMRPFRSDVLLTVAQLIPGQSTGGFDFDRLMQRSELIVRFRKAGRDFLRLQSSVYCLTAAVEPLVQEPQCWRLGDPGLVALRIHTRSVGSQGVPPLTCSSPWPRPRFRWPFMVLVDPETDLSRGVK